MGNIGPFRNKTQQGTEWVYAFCYVQYSSSHCDYRKTCNISRTLVANKIVDNSDVVGASPVGVAPTTSSFST